MSLKESAILSSLGHVVRKIMEKSRSDRDVWPGLLLIVLSIVNLFVLLLLLLNTHAGRTTKGLKDRPKKFYLRYCIIINDCIFGMDWCTTWMLNWSQGCHYNLFSFFTMFVFIYFLSFCRNCKQLSVYLSIVSDRLLD